MYLKGFIRALSPGATTIPSPLPRTRLLVSPWQHAGQETVLEVDALNTAYGSFSLQLPVPLSAALSGSVQLSVQICSPASPPVPSASAGDWCAHCALSHRAPLLHAKQRATSQRTRSTPPSSRR